VDPESPDYCFEKVEFKTKAEAPNTGATAPLEDAIGNVHSAFLQFTTEPQNSSTTAPIDGNDGTITVTARDAAGALLPGVQITMSLGNNAGNTQLGGTVTQATDAA